MVRRINLHAASVPKVGSRAEFSLPFRGRFTLTSDSGTKALVPMATARLVRIAGIRGADDGVSSELCSEGRL